MFQDLSRVATAFFWRLPCPQVLSAKLRRSLIWGANSHGCCLSEALLTELQGRSGTYVWKTKAPIFPKVPGAIKWVKSWPAPFKDVLMPLSFECHDDSVVDIPCVNLAKAIPLLCEKSQGWKAALEKVLEKTSMLNPVLYSDECTAGNVLATDKGRKAVLFNLSWLQMWHWLKSPSAWICLCVVQSQCVQMIKGGASKIMKEILANTVNSIMESGFAVGEDLYFRQSQRAYYLGDHDAVRATFSFKGSAGLRPCTLCKNIVKNKSGIAEVDPYFMELGATENFDLNSDAEIFNDYDRLSRCSTKVQLESQEKCSGLSFDADALLFDSSARKRLPPSRIIYDYMHTYLCNGVASWEISLFLTALLQHCTVTAEDLQVTMLSDGWKSGAATGRTKTYLSNLLHERLLGDGLYKGEAHQTKAILPLLRFYVETVIGPTGRMPVDFIRSFVALCDIVSLVSRLRNSLEPLQDDALRRMMQLQKKHQALFPVYGAEFRPKHHHRMHIPGQWKTCGVPISCEPLEAKHQLYKSGVADRQRGLVKNFSAFSYSVLPRLLASAVDVINRNGLPFWDLLPPIKEGDLDDKIFFATTTVKKSPSCLYFLVSAKSIVGYCSPSFNFEVLSLIYILPTFSKNASGCHLHGMKTSRDDILCWDNFAGVVQCWFQTHPGALFVRCYKCDLATQLHCEKEWLNSFIPRVTSEVERATWGSKWRVTEDLVTWELRANTAPSIPSWFRFESNGSVLTCLSWVLGLVLLPNEPDDV